VGGISMIKVKKVVSGVLKENCYLVYDSENLQAVVVDPGEDGEKVIYEIKAYNLKPELLVNTHGHYDHTLSNEQICNEFKIPLAMHKDEVEILMDNKKSLALPNSLKTIKNPEILLEDNQEMKLSFTTFIVLHTPGHTKGSICLLFENFLITGDTLFAGTIGRTDLKSGSYDEILKSISKIKKIVPSIIIIYPGHGSSTTLANELRHNPYLMD
jgi:glyoxylase-like metal-dependent hydrolase (beta-lactamase superfamily II)